MGLLRLTIGYLKAIHIRVTLGHLKVTIGSFFSELHPKVRQTCLFYSYLSTVMAMVMKTLADTATWHTMSLHGPEHRAWGLEHLLSIVNEFCFIKIWVWGLVELIQ